MDDIVNNFMLLCVIKKNRDWKFKQRVSHRMRWRWQKESHKINILNRLAKSGRREASSTYLVPERYASSLHVLLLGSP